MWIGRHLVAVVTADGNAGRAAPPPASPPAPPDRKRALIVHVHHDDSDSRSATRATYSESERAPPPSRRPAAAVSGSRVQPPLSLTLAEVRDLLLTDEAPTILVACEFSGALTVALRARGLRTLSCDLRPALHHFPHYLGDVRSVIPAVISVRVAGRFDQKGATAVTRSSHVLVTAPLRVSGLSVRVHMVGRDGMSAQHPIGDKDDDDLEVGWSLVVVLNVVAVGVVHPDCGSAEVC